MRLMMPYTLNVRGGIMRASDKFGQEFVTDQLDWFTTTQAEGVLRDRQRNEVGVVFVTRCFPYGNTTLNPRYLGRTRLSRFPLIDIFCWQAFFCVSSP